MQFCSLYGEAKLNVLWREHISMLLFVISFPVSPRSRCFITCSESPLGVGGWGTSHMHWLHSTDQSIDHAQPANQSRTVTQTNHAQSLWHHNGMHKKGRGGVHRDRGRGSGKGWGREGGRPAANQHAARHMAMMGMVISHAGGGKGLDSRGAGE